SAAARGEAQSPKPKAQSPIHQKSKGAFRKTFDWVEKVRSLPFSSRMVSANFTRGGSRTWPLRSGEPESQSLRHSRFLGSQQLTSKRVTSSASTAFSPPRSY